MGSSGRYVADELFEPADNGFLAWNSDPALTSGTTVPAVAGLLLLSRVRLPTRRTVTNIVHFVTTVGVTLTAGQCWCALYTAAGALLSVTADQAAAWVSTGLKTMPLAVAQDCAAGDYYVGTVYNGTTSPAWPRQTGSTAGFSNAGLAAPNLRFATANSGLTTPGTAPASFGAQTALTQGHWVALS